MSMWRFQTVLGGPYVVGGGLTTHYFDASASSALVARSAVEGFWEALSGVVHTQTTVEIQGEVAEINELNGDILSVQQVGPVAEDMISEGEVAARATQGLVQWRTGVFSDGREIRGRTFVPSPVTVFLDEGAPTQLYQDALQNAADQMIDASPSVFVVWRRPRPAEDPPNPDKPARDGEFAVVTAGGPWNRFAVLRSRRD